MSLWLSAELADEVPQTTPSAKASSAAMFSAFSWSKADLPCLPEQNTSVFTCSSHNLFVFGSHPTLLTNFMSNLQRIVFPVLASVFLSTKCDF